MYSNMKYPIGIQDFKSIIEDGYVYVDKTALVYNMVKNGKIYFLSRPRRFGKSLLMSTLKYYFMGQRDLFKGLAIEHLEQDWLSYPVFHIDFNSTNFEEHDALTIKIRKYISLWEEDYGMKGDAELGIGDRFALLLAHVHKVTGKRCVVLIDEYDKPLLDVMDSGLSTPNNGVSIEDHNRNVLKSFYSTFKAADEHLQFVLLTGVTKFSQVSVFSGFNQPNDISMNDKYETLCGVTPEELMHYFKQPIAEMSRLYDTNEEGMYQLLKQQYDGYHFSSGMTDVFNPFSLLNALDNQRIDNYWFKSGTPTYLIRLLKHSNENLNELTGRYYDTSDFIDYKADIERPLPMIYQSGYLTIKGYDRMTNMFLLDLPNNEVKKGFLTALANNYLQTPTPINTELVSMTHALADGNVLLLKQQLTSFFASIPYTMRRKENERERERYFHYTFYLLFRLMSTYTVLTEKAQSEGRADCIIETPHTIYIFEFKLDGTAHDALCQIEEKGYARPYQADKRNLIRIGVSFSSQTGTIEEWETNETSER